MPGVKTEILTPERIKNIGEDLFWLAQVLEEFVEKTDGFCDKYFSAKFANDCHLMHDEIEKWYKDGYFDEVIKKVEQKEWRRMNGNK